MNKNIGKGLTYDDVLLIPQKSSIASRKEVDTQTFITKNIPLQIPFVSSNVDTVTESHMAIEMAKLGCIGFIHRFMTIPKQVKEVDSVKRSEGFIMGNPLVLGPSTKLMDARSKMKAAQVSSVIVVDRENKVLGLVSDRDTWFEDNENIILEKLMTPFDKLITAPLHISWKEARVLFKKYKIEKLPIIAKDKKLLGLITSRTVLNVEKYPLATKDKQGRLRVGAAIGVVGDYFERAHELVKVGVDILVVDIAHAHSIHGLNAIKKVRKAFPKVEIVGGNIATYEGAKDMIRLGCDALKVGIGPGGICITRMVAGAGVPQLTAIMEVCKATHRAHGYIRLDHRTDGDHVRPRLGGYPVLGHGGHDDAEPFGCVPDLGILQLPGQADGLRPWNGLHRSGEQQGPAHRDLRQRDPAGALLVQEHDQPTSAFR